MKGKEGRKSPLHTTHMDDTIAACVLVVDGIAPQFLTLKHTSASCWQSTLITNLFHQDDFIPYLKAMLWPFELDERCRYFQRHVIISQ